MISAPMVIWRELEVLRVFRVPECGSNFLCFSLAAGAPLAVPLRDAEMMTKIIFLGVQSWSPFVTRKSGHIWRIWAENDPNAHAKINQSSPNSLARVQFRRQNSPNFRQNSPKFAKFPPKFAKICQISFRKRALTLNTQIFERSSQKGVGRGFKKRVNRGPILKFYCRAKAQENSILESRIFIVVAFSQEIQRQ